MRRSALAFLLILFFCHWSCSIKCTRTMNLALSDTSSVLIFEDFKDTKVNNLRFINDSICNLIYDNELYELNVHSSNYHIVFSDTILSKIDFIQIANEYLKSNEFNKVNENEVKGELSSKKFNELLNKRELVNYWRNDTGLILVYQISTPRIEAGRIIADNTYFIIEYSNRAIKNFIPILDNTMSVYVKSDGVYFYNSELYLSKFVLVFKDSLYKYNKQRPNLVIKYDAKSSDLNQVGLRFSKSELSRSSKYLKMNNYPYYQFINTASFMCINNEFYLCDNKELYRVNELTVPEFANFVDFEDEIVINLPYSNVQDSDYFLYYTSKRLDSTKSFSFFVSAYSLCRNKRMDRVKFDPTSLASNVTIYDNAVYFFRSSDRGLELNKFVYNLR